MEQARLLVEQSQPLVEVPDREGGGFEKPQRSCDLDDDDDNLPFSQEIRNAPVINHFTLPKIPKYDKREDPAKYLNSFKTYMGLRGYYASNEMQSLPLIPW